MGRIFGTDGARGVANTEISCTLAMDIARAAAMVVSQKKHKEHPTFLVGSDTRISRHMLIGAISAGLCSVGANVITLGVVPTPAVAYLVKEMGADGAVMLSASHNSFEFNGIKIFGSDGFKLTDEEEFAIEEIVLDHVLPFDVKWNDHIGTITEDFEAVNKYIDHIVATVGGVDLSGMKVLVDCANGSASATAAKMFEKLHADVDIINAEPNGININDNCGSTHIKELGRQVKEGSYDLGVAFDGDADRCLAVDCDGNLVDGDQLIAMFALFLRERGELPNNCAVVTVMSNMGFFQFCKENDIKAEITKVGDRYVLENMREHGYRIGGEQSGHIIFQQHMTTGDGQLTAVQLLNLLKVKNLSLKEAASVMQVYPQVLVNVRADKEMKKRLNVDEGVQKELKKWEQILGDNGRILLRPSGTEPLIRVMVEGKDESLINDAANAIAQSITERLAY
ncbi:MAG: phosphoglucosamine mutase [Oscillospiraceae bacterium]|nr:phosphoglucosamine mutase [Oscillospiraceae bacterium]